MTTTIAPPSAGSPADIVINGSACLPLITHLDAFLAWRESEQCPQRGRFAWLAGTFWVDLMTEQLYSHNQLKAALAAVLYSWAVASGKGRFFADGVDFANTQANVATVPDGVYVSHASFDAGQVREIPNRQGDGVIRLEGTPDMVLEVVSDSSEEKDEVRLPVLYHAAGIGEFWRVNARHELRFAILRRTEAGYQPCPTPDGWQRSAVFEADFALSQSTDRRGQPIYTLEHRPVAGTGGQS
jgi:Uma2 family endonuclease